MMEFVTPSTNVTHSKVSKFCLAHDWEHFVLHG